VAVLGHVDHGKTSLLDYIRTTNVASREAGGITQSIGASLVQTKEGKKITFIDTPGHAAFAKMRSRGAQVADLAILVVASDDGTKPQTKEALEYIREAKIPFIVAATKSDLPSAMIEKVRSDLEKEKISFEGRGGDVPLIAVSAKTGKGVDELLQTISLISEVNNITVSKTTTFSGVVIETSKGKSGPLVSIVVHSGNLAVGDEIKSEEVAAKVRGIFDWSGKAVKSVTAGEPAQLLGFSDLPPVGSRLWKQKEGENLPLKDKSKSFRKFETKEGQLPVVLKAGSSGSLEAILSNLDQKVLVLASSVGEVNENDIFLAKSGKADVYVFESKVPSGVAKLAETESVSIYKFDIIYKMFEKLAEEMKKGEEIILGKAKIIAEFPYEEKRVAGIKVSQGIIQKNAKFRLIRGDKVIGEIKILSIKKGKGDIDIAKQGEECGLFFAPQLDFKIGDDILSVKNK